MGLVMDEEEEDEDLVATALQCAYELLNLQTGDNFAVKLGTVLSFRPIPLLIKMVNASHDWIQVCSHQFLVCCQSCDNFRCTQSDC
jgi:hypothetical protein